MRDTEMFDLYMSDTMENLAEISRNVLLLEQDVSNSEYINNIFRAAHTIKGAAATLQFNEIAKVTHKLEDLFGAIRDGKIIVTQEMIDSVFAALDVLELLHEKLNDESIVVDLSVIDTMHSFLDSNVTLENSVKKEVKKVSGRDMIDNPCSKFLDERINTALLTDEIKESVNNILNEKYNIYYISINIDEESISKTARAYMLLRELANYGEPISIIPSLETLEDANFDGTEIDMLFATQNSMDEISASINDILELEVVEIAPIQQSISSLEQSLAIKLQEESHNNIDNSSINNNAETPSQTNSQNTSVEKQNTVKNKKSKENNTYVKVYTRTLDELMNEQGELLLEYNRLTLINDRFKKNDITPVELTGALSDIASNINKIINNQQDIIMSTRMFPLAQLFQMFPKMIRDLSRTLNKKINLTIDGQDTELDRTILEKVSDPLKHIIRNAVDHGIESAEERLAAGKPETGQVYLSASQESNNVVITISDDGKGLDKEVLKKKAIEKGLYTREQVEKLTDDEIYNIIFMPGFSTASEITEVSGRGVGMDIVKNNISEIGGVMLINSEKGKGTTFTLKIPFTLAISKAVLMNINEDKFVVLINYTKEVISVPKSDIKKIQNKENIILRDKIYPLVYLRDVFGYPRQEVKDFETIILIENNARSIGLVVDECLGELDIVIKSLPTYFTGNTKYITGITKLGDGSIPVIIDVSAILEDF